LKINSGFAAVDLSVEFTLAKGDKLIMITASHPVLFG
jgi:hypothetical protein